MTMNLIFREGNNDHGNGESYIRWKQAPQKWEYLHERIVEQRVERTGPMTVYHSSRIPGLAGEIRPSPEYVKQVDPTEHLNNRGKEGWELVSVHIETEPVIGKIEHWYTFKRPVIELEG